MPDHMAIVWPGRVPHPHPHPLPRNIDIDAMGESGLRAPQIGGLSEATPSRINLVNDETESAF